MRIGGVRGILTGSRYGVAVMLLIMALLSLIPALGESQEDADKKPKKPRFETTSVVLQDSKTGLMWTVNADIAQRTFSWEGAQDYLVRMNMERYAGYTNWRMPTLEEMETVIGQVKTIGFDGTSPERSVVAGLQSIGLRNVRPDGYWSSTTNIYFSGEAWYVNMKNGSSVAGDKTLYFSLWPVRTIR